VGRVATFHAAPPTSWLFIFDASSEPRRSEPADLAEAPATWIWWSGLLSRRNAVHVSPNVTNGCIHLTVGRQRRFPPVLDRTGTHESNREK